MSKRHEEDGMSLLKNCRVEAAANLGACGRATVPVPKLDYQFSQKLTSPEQ